MKNVFSSPPSTLIYKGRINQKELRKNRVSPEELICELRLQNITDLSHVEYAILEQNGLLSVIPKIEYQPPTLNDLNISDTERGVFHIIISQGVWNEYNLQLLNKSKKEIEAYLKRKKKSVKDVFLLLIDDAENKKLIVKEN